MRTITSTFVLLTIFGLLHDTCGLAAEPKELSSLRDSWTKVRNQATTPIDKKYGEALEALKLRFTKAGDLASALAIDEELKLLAASSEAALAPQSGAAASVKPATTKTGLEKFLADTTWNVVLDADQKPWPDVMFKSGGKFTGFNKTDIPWNATTKDTVFVQGYEFKFSKDLTHFTVTWGATGQLTGTLKPN